VIRPNRVLINNIEHCLAQAQHLNIRHPIRIVFNHLASDETTGLVAYAIWRGRSNFLRASDHTLSGASKSGASQARSCWHEERVACDDLPHLRRLDR